MTFDSKQIPVDFKQGKSHNPLNLNFIQDLFRRGRGGSSFYSGRGVSSTISLGYSEVPRSEVTDGYDVEYDTQSAFTELSILGSNTITSPVQANQDERNQESFRFKPLW